MASRMGIRPEGSDGSDYQHRETIASRYHLSTTLKGYLYKCAVLHCVIWVAMAVRLGPTLLGHIGISTSLLSGLYFYKTELWEVAWLASITTNIFLFAALQKNSIRPLLSFSLGHIVFGIIPLLYGALLHYNAQLKEEVGEGIAGNYFYNIRRAFHFVVFIFHLYVVFTTKRLFNIWKNKSS